MKVLIIGNGGREHALAWKVSQSPRVQQVFVAPGNAGTELEAGCQNVDIAADDIEALLAFAIEQGVDLTIVGPEAPLVAGICDRFHEAGQACFGPSAAAARLEGSKAFAKDFMQRHGIPTAESRVFTEIEPALKWVREQGAPIVVKADGLAAGKGVIVATEVSEAEGAIRDMLAGNAFGEAGHRVVVEQFLAGEEASFIVMADGQHVLALATSQDHKAAHDGDTGPNTGGMGAYSPAPVLTEALCQRVMEEVIEPVIRGMAADGHPFSGFLYAGLMISDAGDPSVLEFNVRFGDPETQPVMMRLNSDLVDLCQAALEGRLDQVEAQWDPRAALGVVLAAGGYPGSYDKGQVISGLDQPPPAHGHVFHAGTRLVDGQVLTAGGRVLCVVCLGDTVKEAGQRAYQACERIRFDNMMLRSDIGWRAIARETGSGGQHGND